MNTKRFPSLSALFVTVMLTVVPLVQTATAACYPGLPEPVLTFTGTENTVGQDGNLYTHYKLDVSNKSEYPNELFAFTQLPCGLSAESSRTWVNIYDSISGSNSYIYGFCGLRSPSDLGDIWFAKPRGVTPPCKVHIDMLDNECGQHYVSNDVEICGCTLIESVCDPNATWQNHGQFVSCVAHEAGRLLAEGIFSSQGKVDECVSKAANSAVGKR